MNKEQTQRIQDALANLTFARNRLSDAIANYAASDVYENLGKAEVLLQSALTHIASVRHAVYLTIPTEPQS